MKKPIELKNFIAIARLDDDSQDGFREEIHPVTGEPVAVIGEVYVLDGTGKPVRMGDCTHRRIALDHEPTGCGESIVGVCRDCGGSFTFQSTNAGSGEYAFDEIGGTACTKKVSKR